MPHIANQQGENLKAWAGETRPIAASLSMGRFLYCRFAKEQDMLTTLAYSASLPAIAVGMIVFVSATSGLVY